MNDLSDIYTNIVCYNVVKIIAQCDIGPLFPRCLNDFI